MSRRTTAVTVLAAARPVVLGMASDVLPVVFAGILTSVFRRGGDDGIAVRPGLGAVTGLAVSAVALSPAALLLFAFAGAPLAAKVQEVRDELPHSLATAGGLTIAVQTVRSPPVTPQAQRGSAWLPPALTIPAQPLFGVWSGIRGLALATPLAAVALRLGRIFHVGNCLAREPNSAEIAR